MVNSKYLGLKVPPKVYDDKYINITQFTNST